MGTGIGIEIGRKLSILLNLLTKERQLTQSLSSVLHLTISPCRSEKASRFTPWLVWLKRSITYLHFIWTLFIGINSLFGLLFCFSEMLPTVSKSEIWWLGWWVVNQNQRRWVGLNHQPWGTYGDDRTSCLSHLSAFPSPLTVIIDEHLLLSFFSFTFKPNTLQSIISSQLKTRFRHGSQKTSMPLNLSVNSQTRWPFAPLRLWYNCYFNHKFRFFNPFWCAKQLSFSIRYVSVQTSPFRLRMDLNFAMMDPFSII